MDHSELKKLINHTVNQAEYVDVINLSSVDGFTFYSYSSNKNSTEEDKLSAVSSSLISLSNAATRQLMNTTLVSTVIESTDGNMIILKTRYMGKDAVLCFISGSKLIIGKSRYFAIKLAESISKLSVKRLTDK